MYQIVSFFEVWLSWKINDLCRSAQSRHLQSQSINWSFALSQNGHSHWSTLYFLFVTMQFSQPRDQNRHLYAVTCEKKKNWIFDMPGTWVRLIYEYLLRVYMEQSCFDCIPRHVSRVDGCISPTTNNSYDQRNMTCVAHQMMYSLLIDVPVW